MPSPLRLPSLLLIALLGASGVATAGPQQEERKRPDPVVPELGEQTRPQRPLRVIDRDRIDNNDERRQRRMRQQDALSDSVRRIERRTRGQVLSAERVPYEGRDLNRIKVIDEHGRVRVFMDDPAQRPPTRGDDD
jgi:hypothetical protein